MRVNIKRSVICASKLDGDGACYWSEAAKGPEYKQSEIKESVKPSKKSKKENDAKE
ncbi:hypothetical protein [Campylobacter concisus]|uniref:hypothetical protein n=1 Tax=Campylobacter concisus TaxID=199 RepID=UPI0015E19868|nr:hypothetical protein [Campylobacter concisus]